MLRYFLPIAVMLSACSMPQIPNVGPSRVTGGDWPQLLAISEIISGEIATNTKVGEASGEDAQRLTQRAANLRSRAAILRSEAGSEAEMAALRARMARF